MTRGLVLVAATAALSTPALLFSGCGDSSNDTASTQPLVIKISRPAPGVVEIIDGMNDIGAGQGVTSAPSWLDINWASIAQEGENLKFSIDVAGKLPDTMQPGFVAAESGFLLDLEKDGAPDWGIYAAFTKQGWSPGLYNKKTKERIADAQFPGTFTHDGTTLVFTIKSSVIGSPKSFKWFAYTDAGIVTDTNGTMANAGDRIGDQTVANDSSAWPEYP
jgi:hypothetical protein